MKRTGPPAYALENIRDEDVQVLHGFDSVEDAAAYLETNMFKNDVFVGLKPLWSADPEVKIYSVA